MLCCAMLCATWCMQENNALVGQHEMVNKLVEIVQERQDMASSLRVRRKGRGGGYS